MITALSFRPNAIVALLAAGLTLGSTIAVADYRSDIGYTKLQQDLGGSIPDGTGVIVSQVEASQGGLAWLPDATNGEFIGKTIIDASNPGTGGISGHATAVGQAFYGTVTSMAPAITTISAYLAENWQSSGFLRVLVGPGGLQPKYSTSRINNHSVIWSNASGDAYVLRRIDWVVETDELIQAVAVNNGSGSSSTLPLLASAFNVIAVGLSSGQHDVGSVALDSTYTTGRTRPDLVAPASGTSTSTPYVAAAAALLVELGNSNPGLSTDPVTVSMTNRAGVLVRNAERSEVIKAALMAGADRVTHNSAPNPANLGVYRGTVQNQTTNGLDKRYGAGQLNIRNSYWIIAGGEQNSTEDGNVAANVSSRGFDYDPHFGGSNSTNTTATYPLPIQAYPRLLTASLVWNLDIEGGTEISFDPAVTQVCDPARTLCNLNVSLIDLGNGDAVVASSASTNENTENLWVVIPANAQYALRVTRSGNDFDWDYGLAWQLLEDADADGAYDDQDNCINVANSEQIDSDNDGFGNYCDGDFNNNGTTNAQDTTIFRLQLGLRSTPPTYNIADLNANGVVNAQDVPIFRQLLGLPSGPSGLAP
ncbi:MAG: hypothetical protein E4H19_05195 [Chromatiales bacterium]|nr:MAG: hypothetical protein E4H19_05195 [Chromatiales bacterium]